MLSILYQLDAILEISIGQLLQAARAATLLGTQPVLVGLRPELAQTIISLGVDFSSLITRTDLQSGVSYALESLERKRKTRTNR